MSKLIFTIVISIIFTQAYSQKVAASKVPTVVLSKFSILYPNSKAEEWNMEKENYETKFVTNKSNMWIIIDPAGNVLKTAKSINLSELPGTVTAYLEKNYWNYKTAKASKSLENDGTGEYEVRINGKQLNFDSDGTFLKTEK